MYDHIKKYIELIETNYKYQNFINTTLDKKFFYF